MFKRVMYVVLAASLFGSAGSAIATAATQSPASFRVASVGHPVERQGDKGDRSRDKSRQDKGDKGDKRDKGDQRDSGDHGDQNKPPVG